MKRAKYEKEMEKLQVRLCHLQRWIKEKGLRVVIVFEGRDGAGKGGTIRALTERVSPRVFRVVALPAPSIARRPRSTPAHLQHPAAGEVGHLRSEAYNRAGVIRWGSHEARHSRFLTVSADREVLIEGGVILISCGRKQQRERSAVSLPASRIRCGSGS